MAEAKRPATPADILDGYVLPGIQRLDLSPGVRPVMTARCGARSYPRGRTPEEVRRYLQITEQGWGQGVAMPFLAPTMAGDKVVQAVVRLARKARCSPGNRAGPVQRRP